MHIYHPHPGSKILNTFLNPKPILAGCDDFGDGLQLLVSDADDDDEEEEEEGGQAREGCLVLDGGDPLTGAAEDAAILISLAFPDRIAQRRERSNR